MSAKLVQKKKYYGSLLTIGIVGGVSILAFFLLKKHKVKVKEIIEEKEDEKVISKKYIITVGLKTVEVISRPNEFDEITLKSPLFTYTFKTLVENQKENDGFPPVGVTITNKLNKKEDIIILDNGL